MRILSFVPIGVYRVYVAIYKSHCFADILFVSLVPPHLSDYSSWLDLFVSASGFLQLPQRASLSLHTSLVFS